MICYFIRSLNCKVFSRKHDTDMSVHLQFSYRRSVHLQFSYHSSVHLQFSYDRSAPHVCKNCNWDNVLSVNNFKLKLAIDSFVSV